MDDHRDKVVAAIRESLPEFAERNHIRIPDKVMDNLAHWVAGTIPSGHYREFCGASLIDPPCACACPGTCRQWVEVGPSPIVIDDTFGEAYLRLGNAEETPFGWDDPVRFVVHRRD